MFLKYKGLTLAALFSVLLFSCNSDSNRKNEEIYSKSSTIPEAPIIPYEIIGQIVHDTTAFTQGLIVHNGNLIEGTGIIKQTRISQIDTSSGKIKILKNNFGDDIFGEGITIFKNKLYQLTYKNNLIFEYKFDNLKAPIRTFPWNKEGWGITHDSTSLIVSDGSSKLYFLNPDNMKLVKEIEVKDNLGLVDSINELEYIDNFIYANKWGSEIIYKIEPSTGNVVGKISFEGIIQRYNKSFQYNGENVLNGIAWDQKKQELFVTGKNWPQIFKIKFN